ncbi:MAG: calcium/sodium antiporter [Candidatus Mcinerneyibacterium aminivorans]|uniref:Calcium/sodium antiporter n=1 Tax=Candidatus Mcinerneyibacterium aminivorans TaxID=2703815 RepID=A0A5D0MBU5_9BACT|nr:MAG: calcium/sodium antiporter [Candidatus Mcinerneyibacterium aminivorans]
MSVYLLFLLGFIILLLGANLFVSGAINIAKKLNMPLILIGLTIVAFGTSAPELFVNIQASFKNNPEIAFGNILGSNIFNILFILGVVALIYPVLVKNETIKFEIPFNFITSAGVLLFLFNFFITKRRYPLLSKFDGIVMLFFFAIFCVFIVFNNRNKISDSEINIKIIKPFKIFVYIISGLIMLYIGSELVITYSVKIAKLFGVSDRIIGITIVASGTSLPELITSVISIVKKETNLALGNLLGSNIINTLFILGTSAVINPIVLSNKVLLDLFFNIAGSFLVFLFVFTGKGRKIDRFEGGLLLLMYVFYLYLILIR